MKAAADPLLERREHNDRSLRWREQFAKLSQVYLPKVIERQYKVLMQPKQQIMINVIIPERDKNCWQLDETLIH